MEKSEAPPTPRAARRSLTQSASDACADRLSGPAGGNEALQGEKEGREGLARDCNPQLRELLTFSSVLSVFSFNLPQAGGLLVYNPNLFPLPIKPAALFRSFLCLGWFHVTTSTGIPSSIVHATHPAAIPLGSLPPLSPSRSVIPECRGWSYVPNIVPLKY